ncbi:hypothetical protein [Cloacibacterium sp.]|jgi:hypothetical protein|uniref:hypothetical protein n=1 Tax=Cloacibacterium sp. TaxID=1913682 RepID=UPI0035B17E4A
MKRTKTASNLFNIFNRIGERCFKTALSSAKIEIKTLKSLKLNPTLLPMLFQTTGIF